MLHVELPPELQARAADGQTLALTHLFTGASVRPLVSSRLAALPAADLFKTLPIAVLTHEL
jgi:hypothetical protein